MTSKLEGCPVGSRKANDAPTATAMPNARGSMPRCSAAAIANGATSSAATCPLVTWVSRLVSSMKAVAIAHGGAPSSGASMWSLRKAAAPVSRRATPNGIIPAIRKITRHDTAR